MRVRIIRSSSPGFAVCRSSEVCGLFLLHICCVAPELMWTVPFTITRDIKSFMFNKTSVCVLSFRYLSCSLQLISCCHDWRWGLLLFFFLAPTGQQCYHICHCSRATVATTTRRTDWRWRRPQRRRWSEGPGRAGLLRPTLTSMETLCLCLTIALWVTCQTMKEWMKDKEGIYAVCS